MDPNKSASVLGAWARGSSLGAVIARGSTGVLAVNATGQLIRFGVQLLLAALMGSERYGLYVYALSWVSLMSVVGLFGLDVALIRYIAAYRVRRQWPLMNGLLRSARWFALAASTLTGLLLAAAVSWLGGDLEPEMVRTFQLGGLLVPAMTLVRLFQGGLRGLKRVALADSVDSLMVPGLLAAAVLLVMLGPLPLDAPLVMAIRVGATTLALGVCGVLLARRLPAELASAGPAYRVGEWLNTAVPLSLTSGLTLLAGRIDVLMVGFLLGTTEAGIYHVATRLAGVAVLGSRAAYSVAAPMIAELHAKGSAELQRVVRLVARVAAGFALGALAVVLVRGGWLLGLFGESYRAGSEALLVLAVGEVIRGLMGPGEFLLMMTGHQRRAALVLAIGLLINGAGNILLLPILGIVGAAIASATGLAARKWIAASWARRTVGVRAGVF